MTKFFIGLECASQAWPFLNSMLSINRCRTGARGRPRRINNWILDSGAFTEISTHGHWRTEPEVYAEEINQLKRYGNLLAAVSQDMMCEPFILMATGLEIEEHQQITIDRYVRIVAATDAYVMPVLQGFKPSEYARHVQMYGNLLKPGQWVGVGSVCKRNSKPDQIEDVLLAIKSVRPDLKLHGFGLKITALKSGAVIDLLESSDSQAWSRAGKLEKDDAHDPRDALRYAAQVEELIKRPMFIQPQLAAWWS